MKPILRWQFEQITKVLLLIQGHGSNTECPCASEGEMCLRKHLLELEGLCEETGPIADDNEQKQMLFDLTQEARELRADEELKLCGKESQLDVDIADWSRKWRKVFEHYSLSCDIVSAGNMERSKIEELREYIVSEEPRWCFGVKSVNKELGSLAKTLGIAQNKTLGLRKKLELPINICRGQAEMFETPIAVLDPFGSRCRDPETGLWIKSEECGFEPVGIITSALGMDGLTRYDFEFRIVPLDKLVISHDPFTFEPNPKYPQELQPRLRERAATKIQVEKIAANLEPDALLTDFHTLDRGAPIIGDDMVVEAGNGRVMGVIRAAQDYPEKYQQYMERLKERIRDFGMRTKDLDIERPILVRLRISDVNRVAFTQEANSAATLAPSAIENARTDAQKITLGMLQELVVGENQSLEDALRSPRNQPFAKSFLQALPENVQASLVDAKGYLNRDGVHRMAMAIFVSAFHGDTGLRLAEKAFESLDMDVRNAINAIARSLGSLAQAEALISSGERDTNLSIGDDLAQAITVYSAIKHTPELTVEKYLAQGQLLERELTDFQEKVLIVFDKYRRSPRKLGAILGNYARKVIDSPPPAQATFMPLTVTKEQLWEEAQKSAEGEITMFEAKEGIRTRFMETAKASVESALASLDEVVKVGWEEKLGGEERAILDRILGVWTGLTEDIRTIYLVMGITLEQKLPYAHPKPKEIIVYKTTIEKHYLDESQVHKGSIRVVKPQKDVLVYLGCKKSDRWDPETFTCEPNPSVYLTIVPKTLQYMEEVKKWKRIGVKVTYKKSLGVEPRIDEDEELNEVVKALENAEVISG
jgi:hypothetical protein